MCALLANPICIYAVSCWTYCCHPWRIYLDIHYNRNLGNTKKPTLFRECLVWSSCCPFVVTSKKQNNAHFLDKMAEMKWWKTNSTFLDAFGFSFFLAVQYNDLMVIIFDTYIYICICIHNTYIYVCMYVRMVR